MKRETKKFLKEKWYIILYIVCFLVTCAALLVIRLNESDDTFIQEKEYAFSDDWYYYIPDGQCGFTSLPGKLPKTKCTTMTLSKTLPELETEETFVFRARHTFVKISVGDEVVFDNLTAAVEKNEWLGINGIEYIDIALQPEDSGKTITVESYTTEVRYLIKPGSVYLGDRGDFFVNLIKSRMMAIFCCILLFLFAFFTFALWFVAFAALKHHAQGLLCLSFFTLTVSLWLLTETNVAQFFGFGGLSLTYMAFEMLALAPVPIALFFNYASARERGRHFSKAAALISLSEFAIVNLLNILHIVPITRTLIVTQITLAFETLFIAIIQVAELNYIRRQGDEFSGKIGRIPLVGIACLVPMACVEIYKYVFMPTYSTNDGKLITFGVVIYISCLAIDNIAKSTYSAIRAKNSAENKTAFLANMSHEIRTPLNAILGFNEAIIQNTNDQKIRKYAMNIHEAGDTLKDIINSILDITKIEMGELEICTVEYSTVQMLDNLASMITVLANKKGLDFKMEIDSNLPEILIGDETHLRQVLINILNNAVKYTDVGSVTFTVKVVELNDDSPMCKILYSVKDTGRGIKPEDMEKLFKKFERLNAEKFSNAEGTGLGMSIVLQTLAAMNSEIKVDSEFGVGSDFYFVLEQCVVNRESIGDFVERRKNIATKEYQGVNLKAPDAKILIVDDVQMNIDAVIALLEHTKMQIDSATSGDQAIEMVKRKRYDMIFMDHMMPGTDGIEATKRIREYAVESEDAYYACVPIIALTANTMVGMKELYQQSGMQDLVTKPVELSSLLRSIRTWLPKNLIMYTSSEEQTDEDNKPEESSDEWNFRINGINIDEARKYSVNLEGYYRNLNSFVKNYENNKEEISNFFEDKDINNYVIKVHGLKSTSKMIGALELSEKALELEKLGNGGEFSKQGHRELMSLFDDCVRSLREYLRSLEGGEQEQESAECSMDEYNALIARIKKAADEFDAGEFMMLDDDLNKIVVPKDKKDEFDKVVILVNNMAFGELSRLLG